MAVQSKTIKVAIEIGTKAKDFAYLNDIIKRVFGNSESLTYSFLTEDALRDQVNYEQNSGIEFEELEEVFETIIKNEEASKILHNTIESWLKNTHGKNIVNAKYLRPILIILQCPLMMEPDLHDGLAKLTNAILELPKVTKMYLKNMLRDVPKTIFARMVSVFQQYITVQLYVRGYIDVRIAYATRVIGILNQGNDLKIVDKDRVSYEDFYNDAVNNIVDLKEDYNRWVRSLGQEQRKSTFESFSFCTFPFILDPSSKSKILQIDAEVQQTKELRQAIMQQLFHQPTSPYCVLKIRRDNLLYTALNEIMMRTRDLKKPLKVHFIGEEGVDEGGVQKEFFQLIVKQIFDVNFGMFELNPETRTFWFSTNSFENDEQFRLIGIIIGLAIYNSVILDVHFPPIVYKKLLGVKPTFQDLASADPTLARGLEQLLAFDGNVEETFCRTFQVETEAFGDVVTHDLKPNGANIPVTNENRQEYVYLFVEWKLEKSIHKQFDAFKQGFKMVLSDENIMKLFRPEELELMICGSPDLDFDALERATKYADGYTKDDIIIKHFWEVVKSFSLENKKKFLAFCTGSDRVPIKGLGNMTFVIIKNGDDSDRLPTAHTCFNYLMLPKYATKEKLKNRLETAIQNAEGFGLR
jgi:ubiquitin-protein ligase E3 A